MRERQVVIVAFDGVQPLDAVGPHEVFAGATRAAAARAGPGATGSPSPPCAGAPSGPRAGWSWAPSRCPTRPSASTPWCSAGGSGANAAAADEALRRVDRRHRAALPAGGHRVLGRLPRRRGRAARGAPRHDALGPRRASSATTHPGLDVDPDPIYIRDGKYWSSAGVTAGIDLSLALVQEDLGVDVAQTVARWLVMFLHRPGGQTQFASPVWVPRAERSTVRAVQTLVEAAPGGDHRVARPGGRRRHERAPLHPGLHRRGRRDPEPLRRAHPAGGGPPRARDDGRHARRRGGALRARAARRRCAASSSATSACRPTPTAGGSAPPRWKGHPHDRPPAVAIPLFPKFTALDAVGPYEVLQRIPTFDITFVGHDRGEVRSENGMLGLTARRHLRGGARARRDRLPRRRRDAPARARRAGARLGPPAPTPAPASPRRSARARSSSARPGCSRT